MTNLGQSFGGVKLMITYGGYTKRYPGLSHSICGVRLKKRPSTHGRRCCIDSSAYFVRLHAAKLHDNAIPTEQRFKPHTKLQRRVNVAVSMTLQFRVWLKTLLRRNSIIVQLDCMQAYKVR